MKTFANAGQFKIDAFFPQYLYTYCYENINKKKVSTSLMAEFE